MDNFAAATDADQGVTRSVHDEAARSSMSRAQLRKLLQVESDDIIDLLTARQHVRPHQSVKAVMEEATRVLGCCPAAIARATDWLRMDTGRAIGRLRRSELLQLARAVYRFWRHTTPPSAADDRSVPCASAQPK